MSSKHIRYTKEDFKYILDFLKLFLSMYVYMLIILEYSFILNTML